MVYSTLAPKRVMGFVGEGLGFGGFGVSLRFCQDAFVREITVQNEREKELSVIVEGDYYTESQLREEKHLSTPPTSIVMCFRSSVMQVFVFWSPKSMLLT